MKLLVLTALLLGSGAIAVSRTDILKPGEIKMTALQVDSANGIRELRGDARIETANFVLTADEASFNSQAQDIHASGHVHVVLK